jgi:hypothetical protein
MSRPIRWDSGAAHVPKFLGVGQATAIRGNGDAAGTNANPAFVPPEFTYTRHWVFPGTVASALPGPQRSSVDDYSDPGRIVGFTFPFSPDNPRRAWTYFGGTTTFLGVPSNAGVTTAVEGLRVNRCGSIVGTQVLTTGLRTGLLWTKSLTCDTFPDTNAP